MENPFLQHIQEEVSLWRNEGYRGVQKETLNILIHIKRVGFLHQPQFEALETYVYLKEVVGNKPSMEIFQSLFKDEKEMLLALVSKDEAFDLLGNKEKIEKMMMEKFGASDYPNQVYALTMGAGKTILMAVMMLYDFVLSFYHPEDKRFAKNALVFAPDTTIIESLKEIKTFDYSRVLPKEYQNIILNIKYHYLENTETPLSPIGNYNIIISNSQKIILKTKKVETNQKRLFADHQYMEKREVENRRLQAIRELSSLAIFVDEAHHSYGKNLEGALKKTRETINYIHREGKAPLISVVNMTGTPYINNKMISDVVYHFGLKQGIEKGILKQVRFFDYQEVKDKKFIEDVVSKFWEEYGEKRLEGRLPKIAFYSGSINELQSNLRPELEKILTQKGISIGKVLEYHTEAEDSREEFLKLDTMESEKQFVLLVGKGTEGWNCRSLTSCALYRKPKSSIFVLQSSTRCLRSIGDNSTIASIFLSEENWRVLDKELRSNFSTNIEELSAQEQKHKEFTLKVEKKKKLKVKKVLKDIVAVKNQDLRKLKIDKEKFKPENYKSFISRGEIVLGEKGEAGYNEASVVEEIKEKGNFTFYEIIEIINRYTHLACLDIASVFESNKLDRKELIDRVNNNLAFLPFIIKEILINAYNYEEKTETIEEEIELTKLYPFKINVEQGRSALVVYKEDWEKQGKNRIGFHINPYNFDSSDERDLFKYLRNVLEKDEAILDIYFTGGATDPTHNDFYFEYYSPENKRIARYFPDFLIETSKGRFLIVEVKSNREKETYEKNKTLYKGRIGDLFDEVYSKEIGFKEFQKTNQNFEYRIVFNASLQTKQQELLETIRKI